jgi:hypothetical protein
MRLGARASSLSIEHGDFRCQLLLFEFIHGGLMLSVRTRLTRIDCNLQSISASVEAGSRPALETV